MRTREGYRELEGEASAGGWSAWGLGSVVLPWAGVAVTGLVTEDPYRRSMERTWGVSEQRSAFGVVGRRRPAEIASSATIGANASTGQASRLAAPGPICVAFLDDVMLRVNPCQRSVHVWIDGYPAKTALAACACHGAAFWLSGASRSKVN